MLTGYKSFSGYPVGDLFVDSKRRANEVWAGKKTCTASTCGGLWAALPKGAKVDPKRTVCAGLSVG
jgi:hypothetical protein